MGEGTKVYLSAPIAKTVETQDGGREVWGFATLERVDKTGEIADFDGTVKAFEKWSSEIEKRTQGKSKGNVRVMHGATVAGKAIHWEPQEVTIEGDDGQPQTVKAIWTGAYVPPTKPDIIKDIDEGILSAFSIGGSYAKRWYDETAKAFRYIPELSEYSLVDNPAVPGADIAQVINKADVPWQHESRKLIGGESVSEELEKTTEELELEKAKKKPPHVGLSDEIKRKFLAQAHKDPTDHISQAMRRLVEWAKQGHYPTGMNHGDLKWMYDQYAKILHGRDKHSTAGGDFPAEKGFVGELEKAEMELAKCKSLTITTTAVKDEAEKEMKEDAHKNVDIENVRKAAEEAGLSMESLQSFFNAMNKFKDPTEPTPPPTDISTVDGDGDSDHNREFPDPVDADIRSDQGVAEDDVKEADNEAGVAEKADSRKKEDDSEKEGGEKEPDDEPGMEKSDFDNFMQKAIRGRKTRNHILHAMKHMHAAMNGLEYTPEDHMQIDNSTVDNGPNSGEEAPMIEMVPNKADMGALQKSMTESVDGMVHSAVSSLRDEVLAKFDGLASSDSLKKFDERFEALEKMVKEIHDTPVSSGPVLNGGNPAQLQQMLKSANSQDMKEFGDEQLVEFAKSIKDPNLRQKVGEEIAMRQMRGVFQGGNA